MEKNVDDLRSEQASNFSADQVTFWSKGTHVNEESLRKSFFSLA